MKAIIIVGKEKGVENYSLLISDEYTSMKYNKVDGDYNDFLKDVSTKFAEEISKRKSSLELGLLNGFKINEQGITKIEKLENNLFGSLLTNRLKQLSKGGAAVLPVAEIIN